MQFSYYTPGQDLDLGNCIALDTEYDNKDARTANLLAVILANSEQAVIVRPTDLHHVYPYILSRQMLYLQHFKVDYMIMHKHGYDLTSVQFRDTKILHHFIDENLEHSLDYMVKEHYNDPYKEEFWAKHKTFEEATEADALQYMGKDGVYTYRLATKFLALLPSAEQSIEHVHRLALALFNTELHGVRVDTALMHKTKEEMGGLIAGYLPKLRSEFNAYCELWELQTWTKELEKRTTPKGKANVPRPRFNFGSGSQVQWLLYDQLKLPILKKTKAGKPSTDYDTIVELAGQAPVLNTYKDYIDIKTIYGTFVEGLLERVVDGRIYPSFNETGTRTWRISHSNPNMGNMPTDGPYRHFFLPDQDQQIFGADFCLPAETTDYLTPKGWKKINQLLPTDLVWQVNRETLVGSFVIPNKIIYRDFSGSVYTYGNSRGKLQVTENHRMLWVGQQTSKNKNVIKYRKDSLSQEGVVNTLANLTPFTYSLTTSNYSEKDIWLACMIQADGSRSKAGKWRIEVSYPRKRKKILELLGRAGTTYAIRDCHTMPVERWDSIEVSTDLLTHSKEFDLSKLGENQAALFLEALSFWDANKHGLKTQYFTCSPTNADEVQRFFVRCGYEAKIKLTPAKSTKHKPLYTVSIKKLGQTRLRKIDVEKEQFIGKVGCVSVPESYILVRQNGQTFVTGNCQLEIVIEAHLTQDPALASILLDGRSKHDVTNEGMGLNDRALAKKLNFAMGYHCGSRKVSQIMGVSAKEGEYWWNKYWEVYSGCRQLKLETDQQVLNSEPIVNLVGNIRHLPATYKNKWELEAAQRQAYNFKIQGPGAVFTNISFYRMSEWFRDMHPQSGRMLWNVHDENIGTCAPQLIETAKMVLVEHMEAMAEEYRLTFPLTAKPYGGLDYWAKT